MERLLDCPPVFFRHQYRVGPLPRDQDRLARSRYLIQQPVQPPSRPAHRHRFHNLIVRQPVRHVNLNLRGTRERHPEKLDEKVAYSGRWSLRVDLEGKQNPAFGRVAQRAVVREGAYRLRGFVKTDEITTNRGLALRIFDAESPGRLNLRTEEVAGTNEWKVLEKTFQVPSGTRLVEVQLNREESLKFDSKIRGTLWLDDVALERR